MPHRRGNNSQGRLSSAILATDTSLTLKTGEGARFPVLAAGEYLLATLDDATNIEIVKCTIHLAGSDSFGGLSRAVEKVRESGPTAFPFPAGSQFELRFTAGQADQFFENDEEDRLGLVVRAAPPTPPSAGKSNLSVTTRAQRPFALLQGTGTDSFLQTAIFYPYWLAMLPSGSATAGTAYNDAFGTISASIAVGTLATTNKMTSARRNEITSAATANATAGFVANNNSTWRGNAPGLGGFWFHCRVWLKTAQPGSRSFIGLSSRATTSLATDPTTMVGDWIGLLCDSADTALFLACKDGTTFNKFLNLSTADGGAQGMLKANGPFFDLQLFAYPNDTVIHYRVENLQSGIVQSGNIATNLPRSTIFMRPHVTFGNGSTAAAVVLACYRMYLELPV